MLSPAGEEVNSLLVAEWRRLAGTVFAEWSDAERMALHDLGLRLVPALDAAAPPAL